MSRTTTADSLVDAAPRAGVKVLMLDVDGVLVRGRPQDGLPFTTGL